jgi:ribosome-binding factor A
MADAARAAKMADRIKVIVAKRLERGIKDPRLGFVTITDVRVTGDLQHASIFYTVYGTDEERADSAAALKSATGMLRTEVGKNITARLTPSLEFIADGIPENAALIESLLAEAHNRDTEVAALATTAHYAGDEDPYVKPRVIGDDDESDDDVEDDLFDDDDADDDDDELGEGEEDTLT